MTVNEGERAYSVLDLSSLRFVVVSPSRCKCHVHWNEWGAAAAWESLVHGTLEAEEGWCIVAGCSVVRVAIVSLKAWRGERIAVRLLIAVVILGDYGGGRGPLVVGDGGVVCHEIGVDVGAVAWTVSGMVSGRERGVGVGTYGAISGLRFKFDGPLV